ncbi:hypothetical protein C8Q77DRAFT_463286 [Trametes polyzona]|nr:hypothetical protein C8Q77DRAFT_463286 [Trametes polyzona]
MFPAAAFTSFSGLFVEPSRMPSRLYAPAISFSSEPRAPSFSVARMSPAHVTHHCRTLYIHILCSWIGKNRPLSTRRLRTSFKKQPSRRPRQGRPKLQSPVSVWLAAQFRPISSVVSSHLFSVCRWESLLPVRPPSGVPSTVHLANIIPPEGR